MLRLTTHVRRPLNTGARRNSNCTLDSVPEPVPVPASVPVSVSDETGTVAPGNRYRIRFRIQTVVMRRARAVNTMKEPGIGHFVPS